MPGSVLTPSILMAVPGSDFTPPSILKAVPASSFTGSSLVSPKLCFSSATRACVCGIVQVLVKKPMVRIREVYPGSEFFPSRIPDPGSKRFPDPGYESAANNLSILTQKLFLSSRKYYPGCCSSLIRILIFLPVPNPGSRGHKGTGSRIRIRNTI